MTYKKDDEDFRKTKRKNNRFKNVSSDITVIEVSKSSEIPHLDEILKSLPRDLVENLPLVLNRLNAFITFYSAVNISRLNKITSFILKAEELLFDEDQLLSMDRKELQNIYKNAVSASNDIMEMSRKVAEQVNSNVSEKNKNVDEVYSMLESLSPESLEEIKNLLKDK